MILKHWADKQGISYRTALRWFHAGKMPVLASQTKTGTILVHEPDTKPIAPIPFVIYGRVSSQDQKQDLSRQMERLRMFCAGRGIQISAEATEIASGLNGKRPKLLSILSRPVHIIVEHKDRLTRFGFEHLEAALAAQGRQILVANATEDTTDIIQDFVSVVTSMCARIYGRRSASNRAKRAIEAAASEN